MSVVSSHARLKTTADEDLEEYIDLCGDEVGVASTCGNI